MTAAIHDFKTIRQKLERQEQKAEFEARNPPVLAWYNIPAFWIPASKVTN